MKTFGEIGYDADRNVFGIKCEPHVTIRLKRHFGKLESYSYGTHLLKATEENARDIVWFMERYPLEAGPDAAKQLKRLSNAHKSTEQYLANFFANPTSTLPFELALPAREYQKQAAELWLRVNGLLLADDVGLGKTVSSIAALTDPGTLPALVVTLTHLPMQWEAEIKRFAPHLTTHIVKKVSPYKLDDMYGSPDVLIMNYHKLHGWAETLAGQIKSVIFDEAQELRRSDTNNVPTQKYAAAQMIAHKARRRIGLSATPIYNLGGEFYNVLNVLAPGKLGDKSEFQREWCTWGGEKARIRDPKAFGAYLRDAGVMLRRTRKEVKREIPPVAKYHQVIEADTDALDKVSKSCAELAKLLLRGTEVKRGEKMQAAGEFDRIVRQATGIAKAPYVANFVKILVENGEKVVLYGWHRACFAKGTQVLLPSGQSKSVEDIEVGETVMGPDSEPRTVLDLTRGQGRMYRIVPTKGDPWICSENHLLSLYYCANRGYERIVKMSVRDYIALSERSKRSFLLYRADTVSFDESANPVEPWFLGYWLGDGDSRLSQVQIATAEPEVEVECERIALRFGLSLRKYALHNGTCHTLRFSGDVGNKNNELLHIFHNLKLKYNKHIPESYKTASIETRRELLAGLIDSDGYVYRGTGAGSADISTIYPKLKTDILFLARSLGLAAYATFDENPRQGIGQTRKPIYRITISGDLTQLPMRVERKKAVERRNRKSVLRTGFTVEDAGMDDYFGFEVDGDHLFLLDDFTVVHNCYDIYNDLLKDYNPVMFTGSESANQKENAKQAFQNGDSQILIISLRAGAGLDGLQYACKTVVFGELDWSPGVHEQAIGRVARDGQPDPVVAYFLVSETGSDPIVVDVLGLKKHQIEGVRNLDAPLFEKIRTDTDHIKRLAETYLEKEQGASG